MSNVQAEARCKSCGHPVAQRPGRRKREFCNLHRTIQTLFDFHEKLRNVKEMARTDTQARPFKAWLKQARFYAETSFGQRFLEKDMGMSPRGSRGRYHDEMRRAGFQQEEKELFQEAWEAMLWQELFRAEYVTIRDKVEHALAVLFSGEGVLSQM